MILQWNVYYINPTSQKQNKKKKKNRKEERGLLEYLRTEISVGLVAENDHHRQ